MDQFYFEEGYIADDYFGYVAVASATLSGAITATMTAEIAVTSGYYIPDYIEEGYFISGTTHEASASLNTSATVGADVNVNAVSSITLNTSASTSTDNKRIRETDIAISGAMTASVSAVVNVVGDIGLITSISMSTDADRIRDNDIALSNIVNLSLQGDVERAGSSNLSASFGTSTTAAVTRTYVLSLAAVVTISATASVDASGEAYINSAFTLTASALNVQQAQADLDSSSTVYANPIEYIRKTLPFGRPNNFTPYFYDLTYSSWYPEGHFRFDDDVVVTYPSTGTTLPPFLSHRVSFVDSSPGSIGDFQALVCDFTDINISSTDDFTVNFYFTRSTGTISQDYFNDERIYCSIGDSFNTITGTQPNHYPAADTSNKINIGVNRIASGNVVLYARVGNTELFGNNIGLIQGSWITLTRDNGTLKLYSYNDLLDSASDSTSLSNINKAVLYPAEEGRSYLPVFDRFYFAKGISIAGVSISSVHTTFTNDIDNTVVLAQFEQNLDDDITGFILEGEADLSVAATLNADVGRLSDITALEAGTFTLTADVNKTVVTNSALKSQATISATTGFLKEFVPDLDAVATQLSVINKIGNTLVDVPMTTTISIDAVKTTDVDSAMSTAVTTSITTDDSLTRDVDAAFTTNATFIVDADEIVQLASAQSSAFTLAADVNEIAQLSSVLDAAFTQTANGIINVEAEADLATSVTLTADNVRVRYADATFEAFAATLTSGSKIGDYLVDIPMTASLTVDANVKTGNIIGVDSAATISADLERYRITSADLDSAFIQVTDDIISVDAASAIDASTTTSADAVKIVDVEIAITGAMSFATTAKANRAGEIDIEMSSTLRADAVVTRGVAIELNTTATVTAQQTTIRNSSADFAFIATVAFDGKIITLLEELEYVIPRENREFAIFSETREYAIEQETREYTV